MQLIKITFLVLICGLSQGCNSRQKKETLSVTEPIITVDTLQEVESISATPIPESETIRLFKEYGLVNVQDYAPDILVELKYATTDNFTGAIAYTDFTEAWLMKDVAERLARVQQYLSELKPGYRLLIYDAARPLSVQKKLFDSVKGTPKARYVANPKNTGLHNYGAAVDLTIVDEQGIPLDMGTPFDHLGPEAHTDTEPQLVAQGAITKEQVENRKLLRKVMHREGFWVLKREWWHFNACTLAVARERYRLLGF